MIELEFAELHSPLFFFGKNHGVKLEPAKSGLKISYDRDARELHVHWKGKDAIIPTTNVVSMTPKQASVEPIKPALPPDPPRGPAQIQTPMSHVHEGPGRGKTR